MKNGKVDLICIEVELGIVDFNISPIFEGVADISSE